MLRGFLGAGVLLAIAVCGLSSPGEATAEKRDKSCTWRSAAAVSMEEIAADYLKWHGKCVRLRALHALGRYATDNRLLAEQTAIVERGEPRQRSLVVGTRSNADHDDHRPRWEEVLGIVGSCKIAHDAVEEMRRAEPGRFLMITGLCHYTLDNYLDVLAYRDIDAPAPVRLRKADLRSEQIELYEAGHTEPLYQLRRETGERMFAALDAADFEAFLALDNPELAQDRADRGESDQGKADRERLADSRRDFKAAVAAYRAGGAPLGESRVLLFEQWLDEGEDGGFAVMNGSDPEAGGYWCALRDGADGGDLPARTADIDNDPSRPYFCAWVGDYVIFRQGKRPSAKVPLFEYGFLEHAQ